MGKHLVHCQCRDLPTTSPYCRKSGIFYLIYVSMPLIRLLSLAPLDVWEKQFDVNAKGTFLCYKYAARQMIAQGRGGRIVGASSIVGKQRKLLWSFIRFVTEPLLTNHLKPGLELVLTLPRKLLYGI
jgi:hypothetical protein